MHVPSFLAVQPAALVPVPTPPPDPPPQTSGSPVGLVLLVMFIACSIAFTVIVLRSQLGFHRKHETWVMGWLTVGAFVLLGAFITEWHLHHFRQDAMWDAWMRAKSEVQDSARLAVEQAYGLKLESWDAVLPLDERPWAQDEVVVLHDGTQATCWFRVIDAHYDVRCGDTEEHAERLTPISP